MAARDQERLTFPSRGRPDFHVLVDMFLGGPVIWVYAVEFGLGRVDSESVCTFRSKQYQVTRHVPCGVELRFVGSKLVMTERSL